MPFSDAPIYYRSEVHDPIAELQNRLDSGEVTLDYEPQHGYLKSVLEKLSVPVSSQTLVFSKTSFQYKKISPKMPRALYFNDDVYVGQVHDGKVIEFVSFDAMQGAIFYILDEHRADKPIFERAELDCTQCHVAAGTRNVPGVLLRSIYTTPTGTQGAHTHAYITGQESPLEERFGGWYVTGVSGRPLHMGNVTAANDDAPEQLDRASGVNLTDLSKWFDVSSYLTPHSDIVAQLVLAHQTQTHNLITLTNYQTRLALYAEAQKNKGSGAAADKLSDAARKQYEAPAEQLVRYMLFTNEASLPDPVKGDSGFAEEFAARGPRDSKGRSLRDFDLRTRLFKYPCSYLIYTADFDALPSPAKEYVYRRLFEVLTGREQGPEFAKLTGEDRRAILEILVATKPGLLRSRNWQGAAPEAFAPRRLYGEYIEDLLHSSVGAHGRGTFRHICAEVVDAQGSERGVTLVLNDGANVEANKAVLALGNPASTPFENAFTQTMGGQWHVSPWTGDALRVKFRGERILLVGVGLTAVDAALALHCQATPCKTYMISRRGILPFVHDLRHPPAPPPSFEDPRNIARIFRQLRAQIRQLLNEDGCWRIAVDALRPVSNEIWQGMPLSGRSQFHRHLKPYWEAHRHRMPQVRRQMDELQALGKIELIAGRICKSAAKGDAMELTISQRRGTARVLELDRAINCTGIHEEYHKRRRRLIRALIESGVACANDMGMGFRTDRAGALIDARGIPSSAFFTLGPPRRGELFETTAIPEIRSQAQALARRLIAEMQ